MFCRINRKGFTLVEIMIVVAIIALLAAIAVPNFVTSRKEARRTTCISNMRVIDSAIQQYLISNKISDEDYGEVTTQDLIDAGYLHGVPKSPVGDNPYTISGEGVQCPATGKDYHGTFKNGIYKPSAES